MMRFYQQQHAFYCGVDLHARSMHVCLVDAAGNTLVHKNIEARPERLLRTRYEGTKLGAGAACAACAYDPLGNPLAQTDPRGFTTHFDRNELGEVYRTISPDPYRYQTEMHYDANRNVVRVDTQDQWVQYESDDPTSADFAHFTPSGSGSTAHVPSRQGFGGALRLGWFTDLMAYDLLDNLVEEDRDATGSEPDRLVTTHEYDANQNRIRTTKPEGNVIELDYDERDLRIAQRVGSSPDTPAVTVLAYDGNGNLLQVIGPAQRGGTDNRQTVEIDDVFGSGSPLTHTGDFVLENVYDVVESAHDPNGRTVETLARGPMGGATPTDRDGTDNVDLAKSITRFDEAGRQYEAQQDVFVANATGDGPLESGRDVTHVGGGLAAGSTADDHTAAALVYNTGGANEESYVLSRMVHDRAGRLVESVADNAAVTTSEYDGAGRRLRKFDPLDNEMVFNYDANSNLVLIRSLERATFAEPPSVIEEFTTVHRYDSLNRLVATAVACPPGEAA